MDLKEAITIARKALFDMGGMDRFAKNGEPAKMIATDRLEDTKRRAEAYNVLAEQQAGLKQADDGDWQWGG